MFYSVKLLVSVNLFLKVVVIRKLFTVALYFFLQGFVFLNINRGRLKSGGNIIYSNTDSSVTQFQGYETELTPEPGYVIDSVSITMDGTDITNTAFSGDVAAPAGTVQISANGKTDVSSYKYANVNVPSVSPSGTKNITDTALTDVANYANAQVVDGNLSAGNIKKAQWSGIPMMLPGI